MQHTVHPVAFREEYFHQEHGIRPRRYCSEETIVRLQLNWLGNVQPSVLLPCLLFQVQLYMRYQHLLIYAVAGEEKPFPILRQRCIHDSSRIQSCQRLRRWSI
jgi:hypothetical protein